MPQAEEIQVPKSPLAIRLRAAREQRGKSQAQLARDIGKSRAVVAFYELGKVVPPSSVIEAIAEALDADPRSLAFGASAHTGGAGQQPFQTLPIIAFDGSEETSAGAIGVSKDMMSQFALPSGQTKVVEIADAAPAFDMKAGSLLFVDVSQSVLQADGALYAVQAQSGPIVVRTDNGLVPDVSSQCLTDGHNRSQQVDYRAVRVIGRVKGIMSRV